MKLAFWFQHVKNVCKACTGRTFVSGELIKKVFKTKYFIYELKRQRFKISIYVYYSSKMYLANKIRIHQTQNKWHKGLGFLK